MDLLVIKKVRLKVSKILRFVILSFSEVHSSFFWISRLVEVEIKEKRKNIIKLQQKEIIRYKADDIWNELFEEAQEVKWTEFQLLLQIYQFLLWEDQENLIFLKIIYLKLLVLNLYEILQ